MPPAPLTTGCRGRDFSESYRDLTPVDRMYATQTDRGLIHPNCASRLVAANSLTASVLDYAETGSVRVLANETTMDTATETSELQRLLTIKDAALATGLSSGAIARRIERGHLQAVKGRDGKRRIPASELVRHGLMPLPGATTTTATAAGTSHSPVASPSHLPPRHAAKVAQSIDIKELIDRVIEAEVRVATERHLAQFSETQLQAQQARNAELEQLVHQLRVELEAAKSQQRRRWFHRKTKS